MARITKATPHLSAEELKTRVKLDPRPWCRQRWLIIFNALIEPREAADIANHTGTTVAMVHQVIARYNRLGAESVETPGKGGRRHQYMSLETEQAFLSSFFARAERGEIAAAGEFKQAFEAQVGHEVHKSTFSRLIKRHGWCKPAPRPVHPKADREAKEAFKKLRSACGGHHRHAPGR